MLDAQRTKLKPGIASIAALLLVNAVAFSAIAQETVYIGGRPSGPSVEVDLSVLNRGGIPVRRTRPGPPDILPLDPANAPTSRATSSLRLAPPQAITPAPAPVQAPIAAPPPPATAAITPTQLTPKPLSTGLTPAPAPTPPAAKAGLNASAPPKPIVPAKAATVTNVAPPLPVDAPQPQVAATLPPAGLSPPVASVAPTEGVTAALLFAPGAVDLTPAAEAQLDALIASLTQKERVQLKAHASGGPEDAEVRRVALKRALAARSHLLANGMESTRIDVRALGPAGDGGPDDRLDVIVVGQ